MDFANERWVKLYTRDTASWVALSWPARNLLMQLLRKVDRAGAIDLGRVGVRALAGLLNAADHRAEVEASLRELLDDGAVILSDGGARLVIPNFIEAQETRMSASARAKLSRDKKKAGLSVTKRDATITKRDAGEAQPTVTKRDDNVTPRDASATPRDEAQRRGARDANVTRRDADVTPRDATVTERDSRLLNRTEQNRGGESARAHAPPPVRVPARVPARETPTPPPVGPNDGEASELLVAALASGAGDLWADDGEAWRRERLGAELVARDFDEDGARHFGRFLRRTGVADSLNAKRFSPYWFVFGAGPQRAEFRHLDAAVEAFDRWCDAEDARLKSEAEQRQKQHARDEKKASPPVRSAEAVSAAMRKAREDFKHLPKPRAAIEDDESIDEAPAEPNTTGAEQRGAEALGAVLDNILEATR